MLEELVGDERRAVTADEHVRPGQELLGGARQLDHFGRVGEVIEREADRIGSESPQRFLVVAVPEDLQVEEPHLVAGGADRLGDALQPERLEAEIDLRVHERARMDEEDSHTRTLQAFFAGTKDSQPRRLPGVRQNARVSILDPRAGAWNDGARRGVRCCS